jgi:hypothetical protein
LNGLPVEGVNNGTPRGLDAPLAIKGLGLAVAAEEGKLSIIVAALAEGRRDAAITLENTEPINKNFLIVHQIRFALFS